ncbi:MAG: class I SAM-dependent methyltransferase [Pseudomonadota bacterium]
MNDPVEGYNNAAKELARRYASLDPEDVLRPVLGFIPDAPARLLDLGAGTGDTAAWFAAKGYDVVAVEPAAELMREGEALRGRTGFQWIDDRLPALQTLTSTAGRFDIILAIGVLHHLTPADQTHALSSAVRLLASDGRVILSLRHGPCPDDRPGYPISVPSLLSCAENNGLAVRLHQRAGSIQTANQKAGVTWTWLVLEPL